MTSCDAYPDYCKDGSMLKHTLGLLLTQESMFAMGFIANLTTAIYVFRTVLRSVQIPAIDRNQLHAEHDKIVYDRVSTIEYDWLK